MKRNKRNKLLAILSILLTIALVALPVGTAIKAKAVSNYSAVTGTNVKFTKYLVVPKQATIPNMTFEFTITPGTAVDGTASTLAVYAGNDADRVTGAPTIAADQAAFTTSDSTTNGDADDGIANSTDKKYASHDVTIDFSGVTFSEPGVYRYLVEEVTPVPTGAVHDPELVRTLDVNVIDDGGDLVINSYVMYYGTVTEAQDKTTTKQTADKKNAKEAGITTGDKCDSYVNSWPSQNLYVGKKIDGNQASKDKYFRFEISITGANPGTVIGLDGSYNKTDVLTSNVNAATTILDSDIVAPATGYTNPIGSITADSNGDATIVVYLQGDEYIYLMGLPTGATYSVAEEDYAADGYASTATSSTNKFTIGSDEYNAPVSGTIADTDIFTGYLNSKNGLIPTGVILSVAPWVIAGIVIIAGIAFFAIRSKKKYEEQ